MEGSSLKTRALEKSRATRAGTRAGAKALAKAAAKVELKSKASPKSSSDFNLAPIQFLLVSSPYEKKVCWVEIEDTKARGGKVNPLIDAGLELPQDIAVDRVRGLLYVADVDAKKVLQYKIAVVSDDPDESDVKKATKRKMITDGIQLPIVEDVAARWLSVDPQQGHLFYTDQDRNSINKVDFETIKRIMNGDFAASDLNYIAEAEAQAAEAVLLAAKKGKRAPPVPKPEIRELYSKASGDQHISKPAGLSTNGDDVFWGNEADGVSAGSLVEGETRPRAAPINVKTAAMVDTGGESSTETAGITTYPKVHATNENKVFGVVVTHNAVIYTAEKSSVYGVPRGGGPVATFTETMETPRGMVWDGDGTVYVADQVGSTVYSFASGILPDASNQPEMKRTVSLNDAFGVALLTEDDPGFNPDWAGTSPRGPLFGLVGGIALLNVFINYGA